MKKTTEITDLITAWISRSGDILFAQNPKGTSVGAFFGIAVDGLLKLFSPAIEHLRSWIAPDRINAFYFMAAGIVIFNIPSLLRGRQLPEPVEDAFETIRRMKREGASKSQVQLHLRALCNSVVEQVNMDLQKLEKKTPSDRAARKKF